ncbi:cobalamin-dependent protein [uncultured Cohaesibacter sp.]|uniref:cobalamin B12-binding domain-containing protein n=1 Tax=uncultured Cohaesibacter sp. TaxID=1002546 RepID=UPI00293077C0|nr:cobalamin-dependent protein [uncultured Cohaesibacter sp.]
MDKLDQLKDAIVELDEDEAVELVKQCLDEDVPPSDLLGVCQAAMERVGELFEEEEYFVSDLMMSGEVFTAIAEILTPLLAAGGGETKGTVIMGTVKGDVHNIGKDIVVNMLKASNFTVVDLGVDVPPQSFIDSIRETGAHIIGMSGLLTLAFDSMKETIDLLAQNGMRESVKVMIGGGPVDENVRRIVGADAYSPDAQKAVRLAQEWVA